MPRYLAYRTLTRQWLDRDVPLRNVTATTTLSGPMSMTATLDEEAMSAIAPDGLPVFSEWGTTIVREDDNGFLTHAGIMQPQTQWEAQNGTVNLVGPVGYFKGWLYDTAKTWGPDLGAKPPLDRPDPLYIARDLVLYVQSREDADVGVTLSGSSRSGVQIGTNEEPYRLQWWETPDVGAEIEKLAQLTPFDFEERVSWTDPNTKALVTHQIHFGYPRLGTTRSDIIFEQGVNIIGSPPLSSNEGMTNDVMGIGNGEGSTMVYARASKRDGRLRRTRILTDKTATQAYMDNRVRTFLEASRSPIDLTSLTVIDHGSAPISSLRCGDDVRLRGNQPTYGDYDLNLRLLSITINDDAPDYAQISTALSSSFSYAPTEETT